MDSAQSLLINHEFVDLGLSVKWATCNIGADTPFQKGNYYSWGEIETKKEYSWSTYKWCKGSSDTLSKYNTDREFGVVDNKLTLDPEDDVAHVIWGGNWRIPTKAEIDELFYNCTWIWTYMNGIKGYRVTSKIPGYTDRSIFFPAAGFYRGDFFRYQNQIGVFWASSLQPNYPSEAEKMGFGYTGIRAESNDRSRGFYVRPVCPSEDWLAHISSISLNPAPNSLIENSSYRLTTILKRNEIEYHYPNTGIVWSSDNPSVAEVNYDGVVTAISNGIAHITATVGTQSASCTIKVIKELDLEHDYVDLGLSVKWAACNVGALKQEEIGNFYAWGETTPKKDYDWSTYKWCNGTNNSLTKYNTDKEYGFVDNKNMLDPEDDVAHVKWGGNWRMPTEDEIMELITNCTWEWTTLNDINGYRVTSKIEGYTDRYIFLPATGYRIHTRRNYIGSESLYLSSMLSEFNPNENYYLYITKRYKDYIDLGDNTPRCYGYPVRAVCK